MTTKVYFCTYFMLATCLAHFELDEKFEVNLHHEKREVDIINSERRWKPDSRCLCKHDTLLCDCVFEGLKQPFLPVWAVAMTMDEFLVKSKPSPEVILRTRSHFPISLRDYHPLLGVIKANEFPFKLIPNREPFSVEKLNTVFNLSDFRSSFNESSIIHYNDLRSIESLPVYDQVFIYVHGWRSDSSYHDLAREQMASSSRFDHSAIIFVDWRNGAYPGWGDCYTPSCVYETAVLNTGIVGREVGLLLHLLVSYDKISHDKLHLIGFSLGSHVTHYAANWFTIMQLSPNSNCGLLKVGRITGLDPASRQFEDSPGSYINKDDAMFVDIVHTSATLSNGSAKDVAAARFGIAYAVGHLDWYMNGGRKQPSCSSSSFQCHHQKAYQFYEHVLGDHVDHLSLAGSNCDCHEKLSTCLFLDYNNLSIFGIDDIRYPARGIVYLDWDFLMPAKADTKNDASAPPAVCNVKYTEAPQVSNDLIDFYVKECLNAD